jgi:hypothetical protein
MHVIKIDAIKIHNYYFQYLSKWCIFNILRGKFIIMYITLCYKHSDTLCDDRLPSAHNKRTSSLARFKKKCK